MDLINQINIRVTKAVITGISFAFDIKKNGVPSIAVSCDLLTANNKKITSVSFDTREYYATKIDRDFFPPSIDADIASIVKQVSPIVARRINQIENLLEA